MQLDRTVFNDRDKNAIGLGQKCNWIGTKMQLDRTVFN